MGDGAQANGGESNGLKATRDNTKDKGITLGNRSLLDRGRSNEEEGDKRQ
jgi:hypothetical protein